MNARDMFKGKKPNTGRVRRNSLEGERMFAGMTEPGGLESGAAPRLKLVLKPKADTASVAPAPQPPNSDADSDSPVTTLTAIPGTSRATASRRLAELISPIGFDEFVERYYTQKRPVVFQSNSPRFASLVRWDELNALLSMGLLQFPRLRLVHDGNIIPAHSCQTIDLGHGWRRANKGQLDGYRLEAFLRRGATMIVDRIDELSPSVRAFAEELEAALGAYCQINLYASYKAIQGFATHWDDHDVFIVQVVGSKRWKLFGETRPSPLDREVQPQLRGDAPTTPVWDEVLRPGDVLYIPRGWWHDARTDDGSESDGDGSLHLTCGIGSFTGIDLMRLLEAKLTHHKMFRKDIPVWGPDARQHEHIAELRKLIVSALEGDLAREFRDHLDATWTERRHTAIGDHIEPWRSSHWDDCEIRLRGAARRAAFEPRSREGTAKLKANGYTWTFDPECADLIAPLAQSGTIALQDLKAVAPDRFSAEFVDQLVRLLIEQGAAYAVMPERPSTPGG